MLFFSFERFLDNEPWQITGGMNESPACLYTGCTATRGLYSTPETLIDVFQAVEHNNFVGQRQRGHLTQGVTKQQRDQQGAVSLIIPCPMTNLRVRSR
ncbi:hypothetical protein A9993_24585 [Rahnella victoriana]|uniref:hypothetical protein n=1 Tax=Rahnella victoriana TaxID=1510570 RepID=UPI000BB1DFDA|nr:hypothetical protein [Rahnella victoriana]PBI78017.1 hypothetical protein A9993_24585 [Rahnella victoriana]